jgi:hypothetical protein
MEDIEVSIFLLYRRQRSQGGLSRDRLPYTDAFERFVEAFNRENNLSYSHRELWELLDLTLKAGEKHIEDYLTSRGIQFE